MSGATEAGAIPDKWGGPAMTTTVETYHSAIRKLVAERFAASGKSWEEAVTDPVVGAHPRGLRGARGRAARHRRTLRDVRGHLDAREPDKYQTRARRASSGARPRRTSRAGSVVGSGDNVFKAKADVTGIARFISDVETRDGHAHRRRAPGHDRDHRRLRRHPHRADPRGVHRRRLQGRHACAPTWASSPASTAIPCLMDAAGRRPGGRRSRAGRVLACPPPIAYADRRRRPGPRAASGS